MKLNLSLKRGTQDEPSAPGAALDALTHTLARLREQAAERETRIKQLEEQQDLSEGRLDALLRRSFREEMDLQNQKERDALREEISARRQRLAVEQREYAVLLEELSSVEGEHARAATREEEVFLREESQALVAELDRLRGTLQGAAASVQGELNNGLLARYNDLQVRWSRRWPEVRMEAETRNRFDPLAQALQAIRALLGEGGRT